MPKDIGARIFPRHFLFHRVGLLVEMLIMKVVGGSRGGEEEGRLTFAMLVALCVDAEGYGRQRLFPEKSRSVGWVCLSKC